MVLGLAEPACPVLDRLGATVVGLGVGGQLGQLVGGVDLPVGGGGISEYDILINNHNNLVYHSTARGCGVARGVTRQD